jgi:O-acetyl-ADP-ribose deacetylase (regulator of RNase III)
VSSLTFVRDDCITAAIESSGNDIIAHGCNDVGAWGAGFTAALDDVAPHVGREFRDSGPLPLGSVTFSGLSNGPLVANLVTQHGLRSPQYPVPFRYHALSVSLRKLQNALSAATSVHWTVHMPRIGCGLAGASWEQVEPFVVEHLVDAGVSVVVYDL